MRQNNELITIVIVIISIVFSNSSYSQNLEFDNPIAEQRADPWVFKTDEGIYYLIATVPEYDRIVIKKANSINGLKNAKEKEDACASSFPMQNKGNYIA